MQIVPRAPSVSQTRECPFWCGLGQCRRCSCVAFKGRGNICEDCGHHYDDHTTKSFRSAVVGPNQNVVTAQE
jgi:hypothetical protein